MATPESNFSRNRVPFFRRARPSRGRDLHQCSNIACLLQGEEFTKVAFIILADDCLCARLDMGAEISTRHSA